MAFDDDSGANVNFRITRTLSAGTYYVRVATYQTYAGPYTLHVRDNGDAGNRTPSFSLYETGRAGVLSISVETLSNASDQTITVDGVTHHALSDRELGMIAIAGVNGRSGRQVFSRLDFDNMVFFRASGSPVRGILAALNHTLEAGGGNGEDHAVLSLPSTATFTAGSAVSVFSIHAAIRPDAPAAVTYTEYLRLGDAINRRNPLHSVTRTVIFPVRSLKDEVTPGTVTATVASGFTQLTAAGANTIGTLAVDVGDDRDGYAHYAPTSHQVGGSGPYYLDEVDSLADIAQAGNAAAGTGSLMTFRGDFSVGRFHANSAAAASCGTEPLTTRANNEALDEVSVAAADGVTSLCIAVPATNTAEIPLGEYTVEVDYRGLPNRAYPPIDMAETTIGRIRRDGTRVQIPFLTTYSGYRQRVVIVNRNARPVSYAFSFNSEDGATATPGEDAEGTVPALGRVVLLTTDIVSVSGKTRTAATLDVVAADGTVDVATTTMNMEDKGTDTVVFESVAN